MKPIFILQGIAGSHAHGLATPESDEDLRGTYAYPTNYYWSLTKPAESLDGTNPDFSYQELEKFMKLAANGNPSILEVLYLNNYTIKEPIYGDLLLSIRDAFLSKDRIYNAYLGYAHAQFEKFRNRDGRSFNASTSNRTNKNARHMFRLLEQGKHLYETGHLNVQVNNPQWYIELSKMSNEQILNEYEIRMKEFRETGNSTLSDKPDWDTLNDYLHQYRINHVIS